MYKFFIVVAFSCVFLTSCRVKRQETQKSEISTEQLSEIKETYRDTILWAPKSETALTIPLSEIMFKQGLNEVPKTKVFKQRSGNATAHVTVTPDAISVITTCDSLAIAAKIKSEFRKQQNSNTSKTEIIDKKTTGYTFGDIVRWFLLGVVAGCVLGILLKNSYDEFTKNKI